MIFILSSGVWWLKSGGGCGIFWLRWLKLFGFEIKIFQFWRGHFLRIKLFLGYFSHTFYQRPILGDFFNIKKINISRAFFNFQQLSQLFIFWSTPLFSRSSGFHFRGRALFLIFRSDPLNFSCDHFLSKTSKRSKLKIKTNFLWSRSRPLSQSRKN